MVELQIKKTIKNDSAMTPDFINFNEVRAAKTSERVLKVYDVITEKFKIEKLSHNKKTDYDDGCPRWGAGAGWFFKIA